MNRKLEEQKAAAEAAEAARQVAEKEKQNEVMQGISHTGWRHQNKSSLITHQFSAMSAGYDKEAASKRRGPQKKMRRRVDALNTARPKEIVAE